MKKEVADGLYKELEEMYSVVQNLGRWRAAAEIGDESKEIGVVYANVKNGIDLLELILRRHEEKQK